MDKVAIRELVLDGSEAKVPAARGRKSLPVFEVVANSGADFAVRRTCGRSSRLWVMLVSQGQYYVKNERTGEVRKLDDRALSSFLSGAVGELRIGCQWLAGITNEKKERDALMEALRQPCFREAASSGLWRLGDADSPHSYYRTRESKKQAMELVAEHMPLAKSVGSAATSAKSGRIGEALRASFPAFVAIELVYGLDKARELVSAYVESGVESHLPAGELTSLLSVRRKDDGCPTSRHPRYSLYQAATREALTDDPEGRLELAFERFRDYLLVQSAREGMADSLRDWVVTWRDCLLLQLAVYGKAVDKYPDNLLSTHQRLVYASRDAQAKLDEAAHEEAMRQLAALDRAVDGEPYIITHPACANDMRDEAAMQRNCLVGYIGAAMSGRALILFCRRAEEPEKSLVTLEVSPSTMELVQAKARFNREPDDDVMRYLAKWCESVGVSPGRYAERFASASRRS